MIAALLAAAALAAASPNPAQPSPTSQAFADRAARLDARIADDGAHRLLAPGQDVLLRAEMDAARRADGAHDAAASDMLDVIDRQLADLDHTLSLAENRRAITVHVGDAVTVALHDAQSWNLANTDQTSLALKVGLMWPRGVQGVFVAKEPGTAILTLTPKDPAAARAAEPVVFTITILPRT